ncbi:FecR domain-containing protein [Phenylobacterium sp. J367]|uniref:FecR family protein n=1 Tax=Phenylobacterium sp. J367 TaxID=2898435 RepID=UPI0021511994|nr:FecR domain-containing protein [Phenylobacterium sp. J367]MCR5879384.1 FecR domain-containing protein [Phenylobacterium sp. J367]
MNQAWTHGGEAVRAAAADWLVRLQADDLSEDDALAFDAWLEASPDHARAFDETLGVWTELGGSADEVETALRSERRVRPAPTRRFYLAAGAMAAAAAAAVIVIPALTPAPAPIGYETARGERESVTLADGSRIDLNAGTRMTVALSRNERRVELAHGQAVFDVAPDAGRPFVIAAGDRTVQVVGTQFDVRRRDGKLSVTVARGVVEVRPADGAQGQAFRLRPGQRLDHVEGASAAKVTAAAPDEVLGWRAGRLVYRDRPLAEVVADLNDQFATPIRIADPRLAETPVSGVLVLDDQDAVIRRLALLAPLAAERSDTGVVLRYKDARR